jgi:peptidoglycan hydrolase-like protein with peptidoglycan-binding domain
MVASVTNLPRDVRDRTARDPRTEEPRVTPEAPRADGRITVARLTSGLERPLLDDGALGTDAAPRAAERRSALPRGVSSNGLDERTLVARLASTNGGLAARDPLAAAPAADPTLASVRSGRTTLERGDRGAEVSALQRLLNANGQTVAVDGDFGPRTQRAVRDYQRAQRLDVDGVVGRDTLGRLEAGRPATPGGVTPGGVTPPAGTTEPRAVPTLDQIRGGAVIEQGMRGDGVRDLQRRLTERGYALTSDGVFGGDTRRALERFQRDNQVGATGQFGATTLGALESLERRFPFAGYGEGWENGRRIGRVPLTRIDGKNVEMKTAVAYGRMEAAAQRDGLDLRVVSGFRTYQRQAELYRDFQRGVGNPANPPGYSNHQNGIALDLNTSDPGVLRWLQRNAGRFDFLRTVPREDWHWEYRP